MKRKYMVLFTLFASNLVDQPTPEVKIDQGVLRGKISTDGSFYQYMGIPYGTFTYETKFLAPGPPPSWNGILQATEEIYACPQKTYFGYMGMEDCLKVNIYVPVKADKPLPVMVYFHGGAFTFGSGGKFLYNPEYLIRHDVILVTFHYRLGALGFLCLRIKEAPGNTALKDQLAALRWIKKNIAAFGGDPDNITAFGQSAGAATASLLLLSNTTNGLIKRAIFQSGSAIASWAINRKPVSVAGLLVESLGYKTEDPYELYSLFSNMSYKELSYLNGVRPNKKFFDTEILYLPCIEKPLEGNEAIFTDLPYNILLENTKNISVIFGSTTQEGLFLVAYSEEEDYEERNDKYLVSTDLEFESDEEGDRVNKEINKFYVGDSRLKKSLYQNVSDLFTHLYFQVPATLESEIYINHTDAPVYNFIFNYHGRRNLMKWRYGFHDEVGACHTDEVFYLFKSELWPLPVNSKDMVMINWMTKMWTNFAKYGDPTPSSSDLPVRWKPSTKKEWNFLYIDNELELGPMPDLEAYNLWKEAYRQYRRTDLSKL